MSRPLGEHPPGYLERARQLADGLRFRRDRELSRCAKVCFFEDDGKTPTLEGKFLLADLRKQSKLFGTSITKLPGGAIDRDEMLRLEGRREIVLRLINLLELGPLEAARFVEVDSGQI